MIFKVDRIDIITYCVSGYFREGFYFRYLREDNKFVKIKSRANTLNYNVDVLT
jgi:hypothetical protein